jgi:hypothetical protein
MPVRPSKRLKIEKLDAKNIIEIDRIAKILKDEPALMDVFKLLIIHTNYILNNELIVESEEETEEDDWIELSDHESDEEYE